VIDLIYSASERDDAWWEDWDEEEDTLGDDWLTHLIPPLGTVHRIFLDTWRSIWPGLAQTSVPEGEHQSVMVRDTAVSHGIPALSCGRPVRTYRTGVRRVGERAVTAGQGAEVVVADFRRVMGEPVGGRPGSQAEDSRGDDAFQLLDMLRTDAGVAQQGVDGGADLDRRGGGCASIDAWPTFLGPVTGPRS
jgi:hypothetical protein